MKQVVNILGFVFFALIALAVHGQNNNLSLRVSSDLESGIILDISGENNKGFLLPRVEDVSMIKDPADGLMVADLNGEPYFFNGTSWISMTSSLEMFTPSENAPSPTSSARQLISEDLGSYPSPHSSAAVDVYSNSASVRIPEVSPYEIDNPANGLIVFHERKIKVVVNGDWR